MDSVHIHKYTGYMFYIEVLEKTVYSMEEVIMSTILDCQSLNALIENSKNDSDLLEAIQEALKSFEDYHAAIYSMEVRKLLLIGTIDAAEYQQEIMAMDQKRTHCHNAVLANVSMLNRMAEMNNLPPVYDGKISREQPYRRQVADAVLEFVRKIILERP